MRTFTRRSSFYSALALALLATVGLSACAPHAVEEIPGSRAKAVDETEVSREAGAYRDSRLCVRNTSSEVFEIGPGYETKGSFGRLLVGQTKCFDSNNTADAKATVILFYANGSQILMNLENYALQKPDFRVIDPVTGKSHVEGSLSPRTSASPFSVANHTYKVSRGPDEDYWVVYTAEVQS